MKHLLRYRVLFKYYFNPINTGLVKGSVLLGALSAPSFIPERQMI